MPYVIGNSRQISTFDKDFQSFLDGRPDVICVNWFPAYWRKAGFRPGIWIWGDTHHQANLDMAINCLSIVKSDPELCKMRCLVSNEQRRQAPRELLAYTGVELYQRHLWLDTSQAPAKTLNEPLFHYGSTITDAANLAAILFPGEPIRLYGCPHLGEMGHFYDPAGDTGSSGGQGYLHMWDGFARLKHQFGFPLIDCNSEGEPHARFHAALQPEYVGQGDDTTR